MLNLHLMFEMTLYSYRRSCNVETINDLLYNSLSLVTVDFLHIVIRLSLKANLSAFIKSPEMS